MSSILAWGPAVFSSLTLCLRYLARIAVTSDSYISLLLKEAGLSQIRPGASRLGMSRCCDVEHTILFYERCSGSMFPELQELCRKAECICSCPSRLHSMPDSF